MSNRHKFEKSSSIAHCDYHEDKGTMEIKFVSGAVYHYPDCDRSIYEELKKAENPGQFFHRHCRKLKAHKIGD